jgi:hypothetical protein
VGYSSGGKPPAMSEERAYRLTRFLFLTGVALVIIFG